MMAATKADIRRATVAELLRLFPSEIRASILEDRAFRERFDLRVDADIRIGTNEFTFRRSKLFGEIRNFLGAGETNPVVDKEGRNWTLQRSADDGSLLLLTEGQKIRLPDFHCLSPSPGDRLNWFSPEAEKYRLDSRTTEHWREILSTRDIDDEEVDGLLSEFRFTPLHVTAAVSSHLQKETISTVGLVPADIRYYDRLVGTYAEGTNLPEFANAAAIAFKAAIERNPIDSLAETLLFGAHPSFAQAIDLSRVKREDVAHLYKWLELNGDRISQVAAIECGFEHLEKFPELESGLSALIRAFLTDSGSKDRLELLSSLIVLVDGELARLGIARHRPPFWRRLASIAHASILEREVIAKQVDTEGFSKWALDARGPIFYLQTFLDMRQEPRWLPDFILPDQLRAEFIGRIFTAYNKNQTKIRSDELKALVSGDEPFSVKSQLNFPLSYLPGPLEGGVASIADMPADIEAELLTGLGAEELTTQSFISLVNSALIFRIGPQLAELAAQALRRTKHQLRSVQGRTDTFALLSGLATVASVTRSGELADELRILVRVVRRIPGIDIAPENAMQIALVAASAKSDLDQWCQFVGAWLTELAFEEMTREKAALLGQHIRLLCKLEPRLWETCARAEVACSGFLASADNT